LCFEHYGKDWNKSLRNLQFYGGLGYQIVKEEYVNDRLTFVYLEKS